MNEQPNLGAGVVPVEEPGPRGPWGSYQAELDSAGFRPSRRLGQNFLMDEGVLRRIALLAGAEEGEQLVEVGVGLGFLTAHLLAGGRKVLGVEVDARLADIAARRLPERVPHSIEGLEILRCDALGSKSELAPELEQRLSEFQRWRLAANLPYAISSPLLAQLALHRRPPETATVLVQTEVAERLVAAPGTSQFGALTVVVQRSFEARLAMRVGPGSFRPRPKVDSAVVQLKRRRSLEAPERRAFVAGLVRQMYTQRRKRLRAPLAARLGLAATEADRVLAEAGIEPTARVEELGQVEWGQLANAIPGDVGPEKEPDSA